MRFLDIVTRIFMLVCAGLVTLSIIGSIAAIPSGSVGGGIGQRIGIADQPARPQEEAEPGPDAASPPPGQAEEPSPVAPTRTVQPAPDAQDEEEAARWLESIAYALIALCGLVAIGLLLLLRIARSLDR